MPEITIIVPTRGRPASIAPILESWRETGAFSDGAELLLVIDSNDPHREWYRAEIEGAPEYGEGVSCSIESTWRPLVPKLNRVAVVEASLSNRPIGFMGDDHRPRTPGWAGQYISVLKEMGTGVISCPDGFRKDDLPTQWAMTADIVRSLGRMVPARVEHMYCDNSVRDLATSAGCYRWVASLLIEHLHPLAGKAEWDQGYRTVNDVRQYSADMTRYAVWTYRARSAQAALVKALTEAHVG